MTFVTLFDYLIGDNSDLLVLIGGDGGEHGLGELHTDGGDLGGDRGDVDHGLVAVHGVQTHLGRHTDNTTSVS